MKSKIVLFILFIILINSGCINRHKPGASQVNPKEFPEELVSFVPYVANPVFEGTGKDTWDRSIRERGFILIEDGIYKLWYTGYDDGNSDMRYLGYATSVDGISWVRYPGNPIFCEKWTEDMFVMKEQGKYYMYAEGRDDVAHLLTSDNGINWQEQGDLIIRTAKGEIIPGPYGTPNVIIENGQWYLFYERNDEGIWLASSDDHISWINVQDEPVLNRGPEKYDSRMLAANQVIKYKGRYYMYYHGLPAPDPAYDKSAWTSDVAMSTDLIHWVKYPANPIVQGDHSTPIMVLDGDKYKLYTMHPSVWLYYSK